MYSSLKNIVKRIIPNTLLFRIEPALRWFLAVPYRGNSFVCPICTTDLKRFVSLKSGDNLCPACGSIDRSRLVYQLVKDTLHLDILHFSPSRSLYRKFKKVSNTKYLSSDFSNEFLSDVNLDITKMEVNDSSFDLVICFHILEHIEQDRKAIKEIFRILKPGAYSLIQTPFFDGDIMEDATINTEALRLRHYGQSDHVRMYSINGLKERLEEVGFSVEIIPATNFDWKKYGLKKQSVVLKANKLS